MVKDIKPSSSFGYLLPSATLSQESSADADTVQEAAENVAQAARAVLRGMMPGL
jgi:hypothetical protein